MREAQVEIRNTVSVNTSDTDHRPHREEEKKKKGDWHFSNIRVAIPMLPDQKSQDHKNFIINTLALFLLVNDTVSLYKQTRNYLIVIN